MRGKQGGAIAFRLQRRIIPAHAGQTLSVCLAAVAASDHPRACGANDAGGAGVAALHGSSPRMRGKLIIVVPVHATQRIIPAHAGQTCGIRLGSGRCSDHPRACGANAPARFQLAGVAGSSPRMRGKRQVQKHNEFRGRIIPAHAGQTSASSASSSPTTDHPRACGANQGQRHPSRRLPGSSPRMRGKLLGQLANRIHRRIIPAHAGQTRRCVVTQDFSADHPRACGANSVGVGVAPVELGSSPRMRGKLPVIHRDETNDRIIPAHAGQTPSLEMPQYMTSDHPRACGANPTDSQPSSRLAGSSPRMRGKLGHCHRRYGRARIIPAHAGQTFGSQSSIGTMPDHPRACGANGYHQRL